MSLPKLQTLALMSLALAVAAPARALTMADLEPAFRNTVITTYKSGHTAKLWLNRDGSYEATRTNGQRTGGHWKIKGDRICLSQDKPFPWPVPFCTTVPRGGVGTSWASSSVSGEPVRNTLVAGR
jgi:hypothetical protein